MKLPVVFVCENNQFAVSTHVSLACSVQDIAQRGASYNIPGHVVDGNDVVAVFEKVSEMVARAREGAGPSLIECKTYRWSGHYVGDSATYRDKEEVSKGRRWRL
jgi:TPP-dependent pyruvate/acetoin dehydrogenase alpha subunit